MRALFSVPTGFYYHCNLCGQNIFQNRPHGQEDATEEKDKHGHRHVAEGTARLTVHCDLEEGWIPFGFGFDDAIAPVATRGREMKTATGARNTDDGSSVGNPPHCSNVPPSTGIAQCESY